MRIYEATEEAYKNGYKKGYEDGKKSAEKSCQCWLCEDYDRLVEVVCYLPNDNGGAANVSINYCPNCGAKIE